MTVTTYMMTEEKNRLVKTLSSGTEYTGVLKDESSILDPVITIQAASINGNYAYITEFSRYYFIVDIISIRAGLWEVHLSGDVLMTYHDSILEQEAIISRQENKYNLWLDDPEFKVYNYGQIRTMEFPQGFSDNQTFILAVAGGAHEVSGGGN